MKYCTHCGKELFDEAVMCPGCGTMVAQPVPQKKIKEKKPVNKKKVLVTVIAVVAALLLIAAGVCGFILYKNYAYANELQAQLVNKTFECRQTNSATGGEQVYWISFDGEGKYRYESVDFYTEETEDLQGNYTVKVSFDGTAKVYADNSEYDISAKNTGIVENIYAGTKIYRSITRDSGETLAQWFQDELYQMKLEENKEEALAFFGEITYWEGEETFESLIPEIFEDYELTCEPVGDSNSEFTITVSGSYYINKVNIPNFTQQGELACYVSISEVENELRIIRDDGIIDAMDLYVVLNKYSYYSW